jgi:hypothetical protein
VHLSGELFRMMTGIEVVHVPYRGTPAAHDLIAVFENNVFLFLDRESRKFDQGGDTLLTWGRWKREVISKQITTENSRDLIGFEHQFGAYSVNELSLGAFDANCHYRTHPPQQTVFLFDHLVGTREQRRWHAEPESFGCLEIDDEFVFVCSDRLGARPPRLRRTSRRLSPDRELPRLSNGNHRHGPNGTRLQSGAKVRG